MTIGPLVHPPAYPAVDGPIVFLAGPIQSASNWQAAAIWTLRRGGLAVASPRAGAMGFHSYEQQVDWEHHWLDHAARAGVILFWLAREAAHRCDRAYAQTTRFELGEAVTLHRLAGARVVVGFEDGFTNARYLRRTIEKKAPGIPVCADLSATCAAAIAALISDSPRTP